MERIGNLFKMPEQGPKKGRKTERGELLKYFAERTGKKIPFIAFKLTGFKTPDLYYLKSMCDSEEKRGTIWAKVFWGSIKNRDFQK